uniref:Uncharacterized protein n=1 Tax=Rhizophora mucronata TaxID=61149 RepID=A0A2P2P6U1_RHIMU
MYELISLLDFFR